MKKCLAAWAMLLSTSWICQVQAAETTFASFNTFWLFDQQAPHQKWWHEQRGKMGQSYDEALNKVALAIHKTQSDVVALQEVENLGVLKALNAKLRALGVDYPYVFISKSGDRFTGQNVALLSKFPQAPNGRYIQAYPDEYEGYLTENDRGNEDQTSLSKVLRVDLEIENEIYSVFVLHLKSQRGGDPADRKRLAQASIVRRLTLPLIQQKQKVVVMGDLNADRGSPTLNRLRGLDDIYSDLYQPVHHKHFKDDRWTYKYKGRTQQLDHILLSPALRKAMVGGYIQYGHDHLTSDHFPMIIRLEL